MNINYDLRPQQEILVRDMAHDNAWVCHRRMGKTFLCGVILQRAALRSAKPKTWWYVAPTYRQAKRIAFAMFSRINEGVVAEINRAELMFTYENGSTIALCGFDTPDSLRGSAVAGVVWDETQLLSEDAANAVVGPMLAEARSNDPKDGWQICIGTPAGRHNMLYSRYQQCRQEGSAHIFRADKTDIFTLEELDNQRRKMRPALFEQEYLCSFSGAILGAYWTDQIRAVERERRLVPLQYDPAWPVYGALDLGFGDMMAWIIFQRPGNRVNIIDTRDFTGTEISDQVKEIRKLAHCPSELIVPHDAKHNHGLGTRAEAFRKLGFTVHQLENVAEEFQIEAARQLFPRVWINSDCSLLMDSLAAFRGEYDEIKQTVSRKSVHDWSSHFAKAFIYLALGEGKVGFDRWREPLDYSAMEARVI